MVVLSEKMGFVTEKDGQSIVSVSTAHSSAETSSTTEKVGGMSSFWRFLGWRWYHRSEAIPQNLPTEHSAARKLAKARRSPADDLEAHYEAIMLALVARHASIIDGIQKITKKLEELEEKVNKISSCQCAPNSKDPPQQRPSFSADD